MKFAVRLLLVLLGVVILGIDITFMIISDTVMNVGEALVNVLSKVLNKNFGSLKVAFDITCVLLSVILSLLFFGFKIVGTREGTIITACLTGFAVNFFTKHLKKPLTKLFN